MDARTRPVFNLNKKAACNRFLQAASDLASTIVLETNAQIDSNRVESGITVAKEPSFEEERRLTL